MPRAPARNDSLARWQSRHREAASQPPPAPAAFLLECFPLLPRPHANSRALDLACGAGQNAAYLAERGWPVVAVDFAPAALDRAAALAAAHHVPTRREALAAVPAHFKGIVLVEADLETSPLPEAAFSLILCFQYLDRQAFPRIERALAPGGFLLYETFTDEQRTFGEGPRSPDHLLRPGELRTAFPLLESLFYRECVSGRVYPEASRRAIASLLAHKPVPR
jgi:SAM-dependent methyltransferase